METESSGTLANQGSPVKYCIKLACCQVFAADFTEFY